MIDLPSESAFSLSGYFGKLTLPSMAMTKCLISGGEGGVARGLSEVLEAAGGYEVFAPGRRDLDVSDEASTRSYLAGLQNLDLVVAAAGISEDKLLLRMTEREWDQVLAIQLGGAARLARLAEPLLSPGGLLVFVGSFVAWHPQVGQVAYASAKAALLGLNASLCREWGARGLRVNVVMPGFLETKMTERLSAAAVQAIRARQNLAVNSSVDSVGRFIQFLYESLPACSGQVFNLDSRIV